MNKTPDEARALAADLRGRLGAVDGCDVAVCPTFLCIPGVVEVLKGTRIAVGAQNVFWEKSGAYTGEISAPMAVAAGCQYTIIGHSERRQYFGETDETVNKRIKAALAAGLNVIFCVGETKDERLSNVTEQVIKRQLEGGLRGYTADDMAKITIAYEPVWAIGTGLNATPQQAQDVHAFIRGLLRGQFGAGVAESVRIQYGGSVKPDNAKELLNQPDVDGALVGGASLAGKDFEAIVKAAK
jgi:triosephosphate isomerase